MVLRAPVGGFSRAMQPNQSRRWHLPVFALIVLLLAAVALLLPKRLGPGPVTNPPRLAETFPHTAQPVAPARAPVFLQERMAALIRTQVALMGAVGIQQVRMRYSVGAGCAPHVEWVQVDGADATTRAVLEDRLIAALPAALTGARCAALEGPVQDEVTVGFAPAPDMPS